MSKLQSTIIALYQDEGRTWLEALPGFLVKMEKTLNITLQPPFANLSYHYVAPAVAKDGAQLVFKCGVPNKELTSQIAALKYFDGNGCVKLIAASVDDGWMLLERCQPGERLTSLEDDEQATTIAVEVMQQLWQPIKTNQDFPHVQSWLQDLGRLKTIAEKQFSNQKHLINFAIKTSHELLGSQGKQVLLHGDLHHDNILSAHRMPWLAIDPKGVIGEREYEVGALMRNPMPQLLQKNTQKILLRRLDLIVKLTGFSHDRLLHWSIVQAVLAALWCIDDRLSGSEAFIRCAEILYRII